MYPYEIIPIDGENGEELRREFKGQKDGYVQVGPKKWVYPTKFMKHAEKYYNFEIRKDDLWIVTFPRSGTTWMQEILWMINNNLDYERAADESLDDRCPFFEANMIRCETYLKELEEINGYDPEMLEEIKQRDTPGYVIGARMKSPRHFKTHLPPSLLPPDLFSKCKVVYVARNPLDAAVSFYHHNRSVRAHDFQGNFEKYWSLFENNLTIFSPYWEHIEEGWQFKDHPNCLFLFYEDLVRDLPENLKKIGNFLNKDMTDNEIMKLAEHVHIDNFRNNKSVQRKTKLNGLFNPGRGSLIRKGQIGGNAEFNGTLKLRAEKWFKENLSKTDIKFPALF